MFLTRTLAITAMATLASCQNSSLLPFTLQPFPLGSISSTGWLQDQLQLMADGLAGHEHDFYRFVSNSSWLGGTEEYSDLNEGFPYWFNGLVPLAYGLQDETLNGQVSSSVTTLLSLQQSDGWIGPENGTARNLWGRMPLMLGLANLVDADPDTYEPTVVPAMQRFVVLMHDMLVANYTGYWYHDGDLVGAGDTVWGRVRSQDMVISLQWMLEKYPANLSQILLDDMDFLYNGSLSWADWYQPGVYITEDLYDVPGTASADPTNNTNFQWEHGVNVGQGLKAGAVFQRFTMNDSLAQVSRDAVNWTFAYHGAASGTVLADERIDGLNPYYGSELCTAVETMYSLSYLYQTLGDLEFADRCELAAFNALPVMLTPDWWAHQYMAEPNQPYSQNLSTTPFFDTNSVGQTFGLEPNYPCCTVNHPQGYPKFLAAAYAQVGTNGIAHALLSPSTLSTTLNGSNVSVACDTTYPFGGDLVYTINADSAFDFYVRVPAWYDATTSCITLGNSTEVLLSPDPHTGLHSVSSPAGETVVTYKLGATIVTEPRANDTIAVHYGALLYALEIGSTNTTSPPIAYTGNGQVIAAPPQAVDYTITNTTSWNFAIDPSTLKYSSTDATDLPSPIWETGAPPGSMTATGCEIDWPLFKGVVPGSPPTGDARVCLGDSFQVTLVPYGSAKLHMAELPTIDLSTT